MINPYMPDSKKIEYAYNYILDKPTACDLKRKISLSHPYKDYESLVQALNDGEDHVDILSKMSPTLRKDPETMLKLIEKSDAAYLYVDSSINTIDFKQRAIKANPHVYNMLSNQDREVQCISDAYRKSMFGIHAKRMPLDATTMAMMPCEQMSANANLSQVLNTHAFEESFEKMVVAGPYTNDGVWAQHAVESALTLTLRPEEQDRLRQIQNDVWTRHPERVAELAFNDRRQVRVDNVLTAIETQAPEMRHIIDEQQKGYWESRRPELQQMLKDQEHGELLDGYQMRSIEEAKRHIQIEPEKRRQEEQRQQNEREVTNAYMLRSAQDRVYSAAAVGDIEFSQAANIAASIGTAPSTSKSSQAANVIERAESLENDIDNIDHNRENYLKASAIADDPSIVPENVSPCDITQYEEQGQDACCDLTQDLDENGLPSTTEIQDDEQQWDPFLSYAEEEDVMPPWNQTDPNYHGAERHHEWQ